MPRLLKCLAYLFADDTKVANRVKSNEDALILQDDLDTLEDWSDTWLLRFNHGKCKVLTMGKHKNITHTHLYTLCGQQLEHIFEEKDLGIIVDSELSFDEHIRTKVRKANFMMALLRRAFTQLTGERFCPLYTAFVRSHLEYAQAVWFPYRRVHVHLMEKVQIRATECVNAMKNMGYADRLKTLKLTTLTYRRHRGDMIEIYKHFEPYDPAAVSSGFKPRTRPHRGASSQHSRHLLTDKAKDTKFGVQHNSFYFRAPKPWNLLPDHVVTAPSINCFKARLDKHWENSNFRYDNLAQPPRSLKPYMRKKSCLYCPM